MINVLKINCGLLPAWVKNICCLSHQESRLYGSVTRWSTASEEVTEHTEPNRTNVTM